MDLPLLNSDAPTSRREYRDLDPQSAKKMNPFGKKKKKKKVNDAQDAHERREGEDLGLH